jgi:trans-aconitate methyltransferase
LADEPARCRFAGQVLEECRTDYPVQADGKVLFPFCRTFFIAYRSN